MMAASDDDLLRLVEEAAMQESRWDRPRKQKLSLRLDAEVVEWFRSTGRGYQTRMNRILRMVMLEARKRGGRLGD